MFDLTGKAALVTGATGGIGGAIARAFHRQGATVALSGTRRDVLDQLAAELKEPDDGARGRKSFFHSAGLIEGTETVAAFVLFCLWPASFPWLAGAFALALAWELGRLDDGWVIAVVIWIVGGPILELVRLWGGRR